MKKTQKNYTKIFLNPRGVKPLKQFHIIIQEECTGYMIMVRIL